MADYNGTDKDDIIDASELPSDVTNILPGEGNDTVINAGSQHTINSGPGNDNISGKNTAYLLWRGNEGATINLKEGWSDDGYGTRDQLSGVETIHGSGKGDIFYGTSGYEKYFSIGGDNIIILDGQGKTYRGLEGDDTYFVSQLLPKSGKVSITDTEGSNTIQLPSNTYVDKSLFTKNAARLTLEDGREITISGADKFSYNVGGNITKGDKGTDLSFTEFAEVFGVYDILNSSGAQTGEISDMYII